MAGVPVAPPGLEYLLRANGLLMKQTRQSTFQSYTTYDLLGTDGQLVYQATEQRECCGPRMHLKVNNTQGYNVLNLLVPSNFCSWDTKLQVFCSSGELLGFIYKEWTSFSIKFDILDPSGLVCLKVKGPGWGEGFMSDQDYKVLSADKTTQIGVITRVWRGLRKEMFSIKDKYTINFPMDLHVSMKAMLMACALFIDLLEEERSRSDDS
ncbi:phospholipid scramblase 3-like [Rana temporaria]|uniref:phospholipid scramblase 3-like n=1 Tax=Rana temporaria TaxID=8407 RepID=UPI001AACA8A0|nr:phospholipid scramblase 3-like [Rana temporaria]